MSVDAYIALCLDRGSIPLISIDHYLSSVYRAQSLGNTGFLFFEISPKCTKFDPWDSQKDCQKIIPIKRYKHHFTKKDSQNTIFIAWGNKKHYLIQLLGSVFAYPEFLS